MPMLPIILYKTIFDLLQKLFDPYIFIFFVATKFHAFSNATKFRENPYLEINFFNVIFKATASPIF